MTRSDENPTEALCPVLEIDADGTKRWKVDGVLHRDDGPAVEWPDGTKYWYLRGRRHRDDGPAIEYTDGTKEWWLHGERHRDDGPAIQWADGDEEWFVHGLHHRNDGPAFQRTDGDNEWYLAGKWYSKYQWLRELLKDHQLTPPQRDLLDAIIENWDGTPDLLYTTVTHLA